MYTKYWQKGNKQCSLELKAKYKGRSRPNVEIYLQ